MKQSALQQSTADLAEKSTPEAALQVQNLQYKIGFHSILKKINFELRPGETLALLGPNGSGKSTLLKCLAGLLPNTGITKILGSSLKRNYALKAQMGYVGHETFLYSKLTAKENLLFYSNLYGVPVNVDELLAEYKLSHSSEQMVETFSRGMKQRLSLARALLAAPKVLLLDEPFTGLDQEGSLFFESKLRQMHGNVTTIMATHELETAYSVCDQILLLKNGTQVFFGSKESIESTIQDFYSSMTR